MYFFIFIIEIVVLVELNVPQTTFNNLYLLTNNLSIGEKTA